VIESSCAVSETDQRRVCGMAVTADDFRHMPMPASADRVLPHGVGFAVTAKPNGLPTYPQAGTHELSLRTRRPGKPGAARKEPAAFTWINLAKLQFGRSSAAAVWVGKHRCCNRSMGICIASRQASLHPLTSVDVVQFQLLLHGVVLTALSRGAI
jgi:hypothetical protein